ncbi:hypothetical protein TVAG_021570 [Trichomonas vaginalis G3]|uniref:Chromo domain-containing protein n=1 Tax=Trichomonas vaginalis (strain ATCC PRA-98 / G3) TaxID=412133 RepID=A2DHD7_TRIV3|nr:methylated histone binding [Trichomonas vaginalis G3]EAY20210.1 hypothetical protein TVAG_021570 [Trichomonas vaginalis G3]KAI5507705.1 methylated histone binding [Trichomonas vaginalis G3]|eukprot:XP_001581196.1 hypothetical protein [Trichomonas vaginalis G3]
MDSDSQVVEISVTHQKKKILASPIVINSEDDTPSSPPPAQQEKPKISNLFDNSDSSLTQESIPPEQNQTKSQEAEEEEDAEEEIYEVEKIVDHKKQKDGTYVYYIKWKGYTDEDNTWEPEANLFSKQMIEGYWKEYNSKHPEAANATPKEKEKPKHTKSTPKEPKRSNLSKSPAKDLSRAGLQEIKGIIKRNGQIYFYCIYNNQEKLINNQEMKNKFSAELLNFYEKNIVFSETIKIE